MANFTAIVIVICNKKYTTAFHNKKNDKVKHKKNKLPWKETGEGD